METREPSPSIEEVKKFWENNPLWTGESQFERGSAEYFDEHRRVVIEDCLGGQLDPRTLPDKAHRRAVLDLGCGPGFWTVEIGKLGCEKLVAADLTQQAIQLAQKRCEINEVAADFKQENAQSLSFADGEFSHVNCQGVIHHTPDTSACLREIARVLEPGGTASISVYYHNLFLRSWPLIRGIGVGLSHLGAKLPGRGRENIFRLRKTEDIVRWYDGADNPVGKSYTKKCFLNLLQEHFEVKDLFLHFFPARSLPISIPRQAHKLLDKHLGFMIYASVLKKHQGTTGLSG